MNQWFCTVNYQMKSVSCDSVEIILSNDIFHIVPVFPDRPLATVKPSSYNFVCISDFRTPSIFNVLEITDLLLGHLAVLQITPVYRIQ